MQTPTLHFTGAGVVDLDVNLVIVELTPPFEGAKVVFELTPPCEGAEVLLLALGDKSVETVFGLVDSDVDETEAVTTVVDFAFTRQEKPAITRTAAKNIARECILYNL